MQLTDKADSTENIPGIPCLNRINASEELEGKTLGKVPLGTITNHASLPIYSSDCLTPRTDFPGLQSTDRLSQSGRAALILPAGPMHTENVGGETKC